MSQVKILPETQGYVRLDSIIRSALFQLGENGEHKYMLALSFARDIVNQINFHCLNEIKAVEVAVDSIRSIPFPEDYVDYVRIGYRGPDDNIYTLGVNSHICLPLGTDECGNTLPVGEADVRGQVREGDISFWRGGGRYNYGGGYSSKGYYRVDKQYRQIRLNSNYTEPTMILEYITDGTSPTATTMVHKYAELTVKNYVKWNIALRSHKPEAKTFEGEYRLAHRNLDFAVNTSKRYELVAAAKRVIGQVLR